MSEEQRTYTDASEYMVECVVPASDYIGLPTILTRKTKTFLDFIKLYQHYLTQITIGKNLPQHFLTAEEPPQDPEMERIYSLLRKYGENIKVGRSLNENELVIEGMSLELSEPCEHMTFKGIKFKNCQFKGYVFFDSRFIECDFIDCNFNKTSFVNSLLEKTKIIICSICKSVFFNCTINNSFIASHIETRHIYESNFSYTKFISSKIQYIQIQNSCFDYCKFSGTSIRSKHFFMNCTLYADFNLCEFFDLTIEENALQNLIKLDESKRVYFESLYMNRPNRHILNEVTNCTFMYCAINATFECEIFSGIDFKYCQNIETLRFARCKQLSNIDISNSKIKSFIALNVQNASAVSFSLSAIEKIAIRNLSVDNLTFDLHTFQSIKQVVNGYKAVNGIVLQKVHGVPNYAAEVKLLDRVDSGIGDDADTVVGNLSHSRHLYGVYLAAVAIGLVVLLKSFKVEGFESLTELPFVGKILGLEVVPFLHFVLFPGVVLLMVSSFVNEARRWLPFINKRKDVTKVTGFSWTITQYIEPHPKLGVGWLGWREYFKSDIARRWKRITHYADLPQWERLFFIELYLFLFCHLIGSAFVRLREVVKDFKENSMWHFRRFASFIIRFILIFCGPAVFTGLVYRCWENNTLSPGLKAYHVGSLLMLGAAAFWLFWLSNQFQRPLAFNPDADPKSNPAS